MEGWMVKHRMLRQLWANVKKLEGNYRKRYFVIVDGVLFYFDTSKKYLSHKEGGNNKVALSKIAKGFLPLHNIDVIENEDKSDRSHTFVLQFTAKQQSLLLSTETAREKQQWISAIKQWQNLHLSGIEQLSNNDFDNNNNNNNLDVNGDGFCAESVGTSLSDEDDHNGKEFDTLYTEDGTPYYVNRQTQESSWNPPTSLESARRRTTHTGGGGDASLGKRFGKGSFVLTVCVLKAKDLSPKDIVTNTSDPYAKVRYRDIEYKTHIVKRTLNPDWSDSVEPFEFLFDETAMEKSETIVVEVWDWDMIGSHDFIGFLTLNLADMWETFGKPNEKWMGLKTHEGTADCGQVYLRLQMALAMSTVTATQLQNTAQFGVELSSLEPDSFLLRNGVPKIFFDSIQQIRARGTEEQGIFRLSGSKNQICKLRVFVNLNWGYDLSSFDCHTVTGLLKLFLREMPTPLFPEPVYPKFVSLGNPASSLPPEETVAQLRSLIQQYHSEGSIPAIHHTMMVALFSLLSHVAERVDVNSMGPKNLAIVIGPNILRKSDNESAAALADIPCVQNVTELLIAHAKTIFNL